MLVHECVQDDGRHAADQAGGHDLVPFRAVLSHQQRDAHGEGVADLRGGDRQGEQELVPREQETEDERGDVPRDAERQKNSPEYLPAGATVDDRGLVDGLRDGVVVAGQHPGAEREGKRGVRNDEGHGAVHEAEPARHDEERQHEQDAGEHLGQEDSHEEGHPAPDAEP